MNNRKYPKRVYDQTKCLKCAYYDNGFCKVFGYKPPHTSGCHAWKEIQQ